MLQKYDPKNGFIKIWVGDQLFDRKNAKVSVFDSSVQGGDAIWEGLRVYKEGVCCLSHHLRRLRESAKALAFADAPDDELIRDAIRSTLEANGMRDETHIRLTLTRGGKVTSGMNPRLNQKGSCLIVLTEWKPLVYDNESGIKVITSTQRRHNSQYLDSKIHHANLLNNILAKIQANHAGADDEKLFTPFADACLHGITRGQVIDLTREPGIPVSEKNLSLVEFYNADEIFATDTMGELTPVFEIDGRKIENTSNRPVRTDLQSVFKKRIPALCEKL